MTFFAKVLERVGVRFAFDCACDWRWGEMAKSFGLIGYQLDGIV